MDVSVRKLAVSATAAAAMTIPAACGSGSDGAGSGGSPSVRITSPSDGAQVGSTFEVSWDSSVKLGKTDTGRDHVHVFVDGHKDDYTVVGGNDFTIKGLSPGEHTVNVTLQHADHSPAGAEDEVKVDVTGSGGASGTPTPDETDEPDSGNGY